MTEQNSQIALKQVIGAIILAARQPLSAREIVKLLNDVSAEYGETAPSFGEIKEADVQSMLADMRREWEAHRLGIHLAEVAGGFRYQTDPLCGPWVRRLLNAGKPMRLSRPALETLAIVAYRQPVSRAEIESVRGVAVDHILRLLMEMQLVRIVGRSELPGRPMLFGTTSVFLEHFGLKDIKELPGIDELARRAVAADQTVAVSGSGAGATVEGAPLEEAASSEPAPAESPAATIEPAAAQTDEVVNGSEATT